MSQDSDNPQAFIADLVARSRAAQKQIEHYSQEQVDALIRAMVWSVARPGVAEEIAQLRSTRHSWAITTASFSKFSAKPAPRYSISLMTSRLV